MFNKDPFVQIDLTVHVMEYDTSKVDILVEDQCTNTINPTKKSCHFELHVKKNTCVEEAFYETFLNAKKLLETAMKEDKKE
jgi:hypothetical protein